MPIRRLINLVLLFFGLLLLALAGASLAWSHLHDAAVLLYCGMLIERFGMVPYRDFFDMNLPGAHLAYAALGRVFGYGDLGFRLADLGCLAALLGLSWAWMRALDRRAALAGALVFGLAYLGGGETHSMQRDFLVLLPIAAALALATARRPGPLVRALLAGVCFGAAATVKPHAAIGLIPLGVYLAFAFQAEPQNRSDGSYGTYTTHKLILALLLGFGLPLAAMAAWLAAAGALDEFFDMALHYWPLYGGLTGGHYPVRGLDRLTYLGEEFQKLGGLGPWLVPAVLGLTLFLTQSSIAPERRRLAALLAGLAAVYALYPVLTGQFWSYHWLPLHYFAIQAGALCLAGPAAAPAGSAPRKGAALVWLALTLPLVCMLPAMQPWSKFKWLPADNPAKAALIANYLKAKLRPGDTVQTLDWCAGGVHGALLAGVRPATRFIYDFHFYHDVSNPIIQGLRARLMQELARSRPRFIVQTVGDRPTVKGEDTTTRFEALEIYMQTNYQPVSRGPGFVIYERSGVQ